MAVQSIRIEGIQGLAMALERLPAELQRAAESAVLRSGAKPIHKAAKSNASRSKDSGLLMKSIGITVKKTRTGQLTSRVGVRSGFKGRSLGFKISKRGKNKGKMTERFQNPVNYAHLVEYGTSHSAAKPFIRPAIESTQDQVMGAMAAGYEKHLTKVVARIRRK
jgi:HK97 gp10 family phage protein